jgi:hypothetical protein
VPRVFLSYGREDLLAAKRVRRYLVERGIDVWADFASLRPGEIWADAISDALSHSDFVVLLLSNSSVSRRGFIQREIREAIRVWSEMPPARPFLIPARLDECKMPSAALNGIDWVDLFKNWRTGIRGIGQVVGVEPKKSKTAREDEQRGRRKRSQNAGMKGHRAPLMLLVLVDFDSDSVKSGILERFRRFPGVIEVRPLLGEHDVFVAIEGEPRDLSAALDAMSRLPGISRFNVSLGL